MTFTPRRTLLAVAAVAAVLAVAGVVTFAALHLSASGPSLAGAAAPIASSDPAPAPSRTPRAFAAFGSLTLADSYTGSPECRGQSGYSDIKGGAGVYVHDRTGATVARATLQAGGADTGGCVFAFTVTGIPAGLGTYTIAIGSHQGTTMNESDLARGAPINLVLGG